MSCVIENSVDIELFIEGKRDLLFNNITQQSRAHDHLSPEGTNDSKLRMVDQSSRPPVIVADSQISGIPIPFIYTVYESFWSESESKRVFKVKHLSSEYYYYAFILHDYIVCPAFLADSLKITNYACLNVIYGTNYSYIFVKMKINNAKRSKALTRVEILCGVYVKLFRKYYLLYYPTQYTQIDIKTIIGAIVLIKINF
jgi:hypothetical protein